MVFGRGTARNRPRRGEDSPLKKRTFWVRSDPCSKEKKEGIVGWATGVWEVGREDRDFTRGRFGLSNRRLLLLSS